MNFTIDEAREFLTHADVFIGFDDDDPEDRQTLSFSDCFAWATADACYVLDQALPRVAELFSLYGWCGLLWWGAKQLDLTPEFADVRRFVEFVDHEETLRREMPDSNKRAFHFITYQIGPTNENEK